MIHAKYMTSHEIATSLPKNYDWQVCPCTDGNTKLVITDPQYPAEHWILPEYWLLDRHGEPRCPLDCGRDIDYQTTRVLFEECKQYRIFFGHWHDDLQAFEICHYPIDANYIYGYPVWYDDSECHPSNKVKVRSTEKKRLLKPINGNQLIDFTFEAMAKFVSAHQANREAYQTYCSEISKYRNAFLCLVPLFATHGLVLDTETDPLSVHVYHQDAPKQVRVYYFEATELQRLIDENIPPEGEIKHDR